MGRKLLHKGSGIARGWYVRKQPVSTPQTPTDVKLVCVIDRSWMNENVPIMPEYLRAWVLSRTGGRLSSKQVNECVQFVPEWNEESLRITIYCGNSLIIARWVQTCIRVWLRQIENSCRKEE